MWPKILRRFRSFFLLSGCLAWPLASADAHEHHAPHGGTLVEVGEDFAHLPFSLVPSSS